MLTTEQIAALYVSVYGRAPETSGLMYWSTQFTGNFEQAVAEFVRHPLFGLQYASLSNEAKVESFYKQMLGGYGDPDGVAYWAGRLDAGDTVASVLAAFIRQSIEGDFSVDSAALARQQTLKNKIEVGLFYAQTFGLKSEFHAASDAGSIHIHADLAYQQAVRAIAQVDYTGQSVEQAKQALLAALTGLGAGSNGGIDQGTGDSGPVSPILPVAPPTVIVVPTDNNKESGPANPYLLTVGVDHLQGDANDNHFYAPISTIELTGVQLQTLSIGDKVEGGAGHNSLYATLLGGAMSAVVKPVLQQVQQVYVQSLGGSTLDLSASDGVQTVYVDGVFDLTHVQGLQQADVVLQQVGSSKAPLMLTGITSTDFYLGLEQVGGPQPLVVGVDALSAVSTVSIEALAGKNAVQLLPGSPLMIDAMTTVVLQAAVDSQLVLDASLWLGAVDSALTIYMAGAGQMVYKGDSKNTVAETFVFTDASMSRVELQHFFAGSTALADCLDLSALGVPSWADLHVSYTDIGAVIQAISADAFSGEIVLLGVSALTENHFVFSDLS